MPVLIYLASRSAASRGLAYSLRAQPRSNILLQYIERNCPAAENDVMEFAYVKTRAQLIFGQCAQLANLELPDLIGQSLTGPGDITVYLIFDLEVALRRVCLEERECLLAIPMFVMDAGVDDETQRAPHVEGQLAKLVIRIAQHTQLVSQTLRIECPALGEGRGIELAS